MKKIILFIIMCMIVSVSVSGYVKTEIPNSYDHFRMTEENLIVAETSNSLIYYDEGVNIDLNISTLTYSSYSFLEQGIPIYNNSNALAKMINASLIGVVDNSFYTIDLTVFYNTIALKHIYSRLLGITEDYYLISAQYGTNALFYAIDKDDQTDYTLNTYNYQTNLRTATDFILPTLDLGFPSSSSDFANSFIPYYDDNKYYNYIGDGDRQNLYPIYYNDYAINTRIMTYGDSTSLMGNLAYDNFYTVLINGENYITASDNTNVDYQSGNKFRVLEMSIKDNVFSTTRNYDYIDKAETEQEIEQGAYVEKGIYRLTHDNLGNITYTINDIEPKNFDIDLTCENGRCDYGSFGLLGYNIIWMDSDDTLYYISGSPTVDANPSIELFGNIYAPEYNTEHKDIVEDFLILKNNSDTITHPYDWQNATYVVGVGKEIDLIHPIYLKLDENINKETSLTTTAFMVRSEDDTNDYINIAYECDFGDITKIGDSDNYNGTPLELTTAYNTSCGFYAVETPDILAGTYLDDTHSLLFGECDDTYNFPVTLYSQYYNTLITSLVIGEGRGVTYNLKNRYGDIVSTFTIKHQKISDTYNYAWIIVNNETVYNTTSVNNLVNNNIDIVISMYPTKTVYNFYGLATGSINEEILLPVRTIEIQQYNKTNTTLTPDYNYIGAWLMLNTGYYPIQNDGVELIDSDTTFRFYEFECKYSVDDENEEKVLRVYYDDDYIQYDRYKDYRITYNPALAEYILPQSSVDKTIEDELDATRIAEMNNAVCNAFNVCSTNDRLIFAVVLTAMLMMGSAIFMSKGFENTPAIALVPSVLGILCIVFFTVYKFIPQWFTILMAIGIAGVLVAKLNPVGYFGGGGNRGGSDWGR